MPVFAFIFEQLLVYAKIYNWYVFISPQDGSIHLGNKSKYPLQVLFPPLQYRLPLYVQNDECSQQNYPYLYHCPHPSF